MELVIGINVNRIGKANRDKVLLNKSPAEVKMCLSLVNRLQVYHPPNLIYKAVFRRKKNIVSFVVLG